MIDEEYKWDDIPDDDPRAVAYREKLWNELTPEEREAIDRDVAEAIARINGNRK
ncbi:MAG: hypothetical protein J6B55_03975 [Clostridia bacterium]|nr:hypothetical protein [Clostridia bacterium]